MILVVSLNPALDLTYEVETADWAGVNRPHTVHVRPGGKGVNVARTLSGLGTEVVLAGLVGGGTGDELIELLAGSGVRLGLTRIAGPTRRTFTVVDAGRRQAALFNEPGPPVLAGEYSEFVAGYQATLDECSAVVLSGSLPAGIEADAYAGLITAAQEASVPVILDTSGPALTLGAAAGPTLIKPNLAELEQAVGRPLISAPAVSPPTDLTTVAPAITPTPPITPAPAGDLDPARSGAPCCRSGDIGGTSLSLVARLSLVASAARELARVDRTGVVVSLGADGLLAVSGDGCWLARPGERVSGNPTGAGDAVVAGLADGLVRGFDWPERLRHAVALGTATAEAPVAGEFARADYERQYRRAEVTGEYR